MSVSKEHRQKIREELLRAGMTKYGLQKGESKNLPEVIHPNEHIGGVIYGRSEGESAMFVATNLRMIFMEHRPFFRINDEIAYKALSGVSRNAQGYFATVTVHTRVGDYTIRFVNKKCASIFVKYIENQRLEETRESTKPKPLAPAPIPQVIHQDARIFLLSHALATLSTIDGNNNVSGASVHYVLGEDNSFYLVTKSDTRKARNILTHPQAALTVTDSNSMQTAQIQGIAELENNPRQKQKIINSIIKPRLYDTSLHWPPITQLAAGNYVVIRVVPTSIEFYDFKK